MYFVEFVVMKWMPLAAPILLNPIQELARQLPTADRAFGMGSQKLSG